MMTELVEIRPGRLLSVSHQAGDSDPTIFLCHGAGGNKNQWRKQWQASAPAGLSTVAWDCFGHGDSPQPRRRAAYAGAEFVDDMEAVFERYASTRNLLVAHSYGTRLTLCLLARLAALGKLDRVAGVLLIGPPPVEPRLVGGLMRWAPAFVLEWLRPQLSAGFRRLAWHPDADPVLVAAEEQATRRNSLFMMRALMTQAASLDPASLAALTVPITVVTGDSDRLTPPAAGRDLSERLPNASFRLIDRCGHQVMLERPEETNAILFDLVERVQAA